MNDMNTITAYAEEITVNRMGATDYQVIDAAQSVGKKYPVVIGHVNVIHGFLHYTGDRYSTHKGVEAVIAPKAAQGPNHAETIQLALRAGITSGRDDRR
jgi:hypothetical protein